MAYSFAPAGAVLAVLVLTSPLVRAQGNANREELNRMNRQIAALYEAGIRHSRAGGEFVNGLRHQRGADDLEVAKHAAKTKEAEKSGGPKVATQLDLGRW